MTISCTHPDGLACEDVESLLTEATAEILRLTHENGHLRAALATSTSQ